jgi:hypothetical protein
MKMTMIYTKMQLYYDILMKNGFGEFVQQFFELDNIILCFDGCETPPKAESRLRSATRSVTSNTLGTHPYRNI